MNNSHTKLAGQVVKEKDKLIKDAISHKIGSENWSITDIANRGEMSILPDKTEVFSFDGQELIRFWPATTKTVCSGTGFSGTAEQKYQLLYLPPKADLPEVGGA